MKCPLCHGLNVTAFYRHNLKYFGRWKETNYLSCQDCHLIFQDPNQRPTRQEELERYKTHNNDGKDPGYRKFLNQLLNPVLKLSKPQAIGLDYGCGPSRVMENMGREQGYEIHSFDPLFYPCKEILGGRYDFITCNEVLEHMHHPAREFDRLVELLRVGGLLGIQTGQLDDWQAFAEWHYHKDPTHVCFYRDSTFNFICSHWGLKILYDRRGVKVLSR